MKKMLVISPHCDDAELGVGGYMSRFVDDGGTVLQLVGTVSDVFFEHQQRVVSVQERVYELAAACRITGSNHEILTRDLDGCLYTFPMSKMVWMIDKAMASFLPDIVLLPIPSSHQDHRYMYEASIAACRPTPAKFHIQLIAAYEYPVGGWGVDQGFHGGMYVDISQHWERKKAALQCFGSQMKGEDSLISVFGADHLARLRGVESGFKYAEFLRILRSRVTY